jgi:hypothetical protein
MSQSEEEDETVQALNALKREWEQRHSNKQGSAPTSPRFEPRHFYTKAQETAGALGETSQGGMAWKTVRANG